MSEGCRVDRENGKKQRGYLEARRKCHLETCQTNSGSEASALTRKTPRILHSKHQCEKREMV